MSEHVQDNNYSFELCSENSKLVFFNKNKKLLVLCHICYITTSFFWFSVTNNTENCIIGWQIL